MGVERDLVLLFSIIQVMPIGERNIYEQEASVEFS